MAKQPADFHSLEAALFSARKIAEELDEVVVLYFIDMAIAHAKMKRPPITNLEPVGNQEVHGRKQIYHPGSGAPSRSSFGLATSRLYRLPFES